MLGKSEDLDELE